MFIVLAEDVNKEVINSALPEQIRVLDIRRVTKGFNSKNSCDGRTYSYTCPTFAFAPPEATINFDYRTDSTVVDRINEIVKNFLGCHNYHNYTSKKYVETIILLFKFVFSLSCSLKFK